MAILPQWRQAARGLRTRPAFTLTALLVLSLGIAAVTILWAVVDTVLLKPLPYPHADRLALVLEANPAKKQNESLIAPARLEDWNRMNQSFSAIAGVYADSVTDTSGPEPRRYAADRVSPRYFQVYGVPALLGRTFTPEEERPALGATGPGAAVISYGLWTRRFNRRSDAIGSRMIFGGAGYSIVGVMPASFAPPGVDLWLPANLPASLMTVRDARFYSGIGRMKPGVTLVQARADLDRVEQQLGRTFPATDAGWSASVKDLKEYRVGSYRATLWSVFTALALLFLIAVANIAGLTLTQFQRRERELAIRSAIGASRGQVVAALMREVFLLAAAGAVFGALLASAAIRSIAANATTLPRMAELSFDPRAWLFTVIAALIAALGFGLVPALQATRLHLSTLMAAGAGADGRRRRLQHVLVVAQLAITVTLLAAAGLLARSFYSLDRVAPGFDPTHVYTFHVGAGWSDDRPAIGRMQQQLLAGLRALPGSSDAGYANFLPVSDATLQFQIRLAGSAGSGTNGLDSVGERTISSDYLQTLGVPLLAGSWCPPTQNDFHAPVSALVNRRFVEVYGGGESVVGRNFRMAADSDTATPQRIVGVVGDVRENAITEPPTPFLYECLAAGSWPDPEYVARTSVDEASFASALRALVHRVAPGRAIFGLHPLTDDIAANLEQPRLNLRFLSLFATLAMVLAAIGLYSLISLLVLGRTREIGIRIALGAGRGEILAMVAAGAARLVVLGIAAGVLLSLPVLQLLKANLYGIHSFDALSLAAAIALLLAVAALATILPARRAAKTDAWRALRQE